MAEQPMAASSQAFDKQLSIRVSRFLDYLIFKYLVKEIGKIRINEHFLINSACEYVNK